MNDIYTTDIYDLFLNQVPIYSNPLKFKVVRYSLKLKKFIDYVPQPTLRN